MKFTTKADRTADTKAKTIKMNPPAFSPFGPMDLRAFVKAAPSKPAALRMALACVSCLPADALSRAEAEAAALARQWLLSRDPSLEEVAELNAERMGATGQHEPLARCLHLAVADSRPEGSSHKAPGAAHSAGAAAQALRRLTLGHQGDHANVVRRLVARCEAASEVEVQ